MFMNAFAQETDGGFLPSRFGLSGFYEVFVRRPDYLVKFWNSILLSVAIVAGQGIISCLAGDGVANLIFRLKRLFIMQ